MNNINLYEKIPAESFPIQLLEFDSMPSDFFLHWHEHTEIILVTEGWLKVRCGERIITATKGDCIIFNGNELHEGLSCKCKFRCIHFSPSFFEDQYVLFENVVKDNFVIAQIDNIFNNYKNPNQVSMLEIRGYSYLLISHLIKNYTEKTFTEIRYQQYSKKSNKLNDAIKFIEQNYAEDISTAFLARLSHLSEGYFCHIFRETTGKSAKEYIAHLRIEKAIDLIKTTDMTILEIAMQCGFSDANYFARIFKKYKGFTPTSLRL